MEDQAQRHAFTRSHPADPVANRAGDGASFSGSRSDPVWENDGFTQAKRKRFASGLGPGFLLCEKKFASGESGLRIRDQNGDLKRKSEFAVQVLMKAVIPPLLVSQQQGGGASLTGVMASP